MIAPCEHLSLTSPGVARSSIRLLPDWHAKKKRRKRSCAPQLLCASAWAWRRAYKIGLRPSTWTGREGAPRLCEWRGAAPCPCDYAPGLGHLLRDLIGALWLTPRRAEAAPRESLARISRIPSYRDWPPVGWWCSSISKVFASIHLALHSAGRPRSEHDSGGILLSNSRWPHLQTQFDKLPPKEIRARSW